MAGNSQALSLTKLVEAFASLPGIGMKSAQRLAYYVLKQPDSQVEAFAQALLDAKKEHQALRLLSEPHRPGTLPHLRRSGAGQVHHLRGGGP